VNSFFMINRIFQRVVCVTRVYGLRYAWLVPVRIPVANLINACASVMAAYKYYRSRATGKKLAWSKTEHELPVGFGLEPVARPPFPGVPGSASGATAVERKQAG
jgi:hypothetical protein